jgi:hypothetical protein
VGYEQAKHYVLDFKNDLEYDDNFESTIVYFEKNLLHKVFDLQPFSGNPDIYIHYGR